MERANRIAVQTVGEGFKADFYRTHKHVAEMLSTDTIWEASKDANKTAQRESFRQFAIANAEMVGVEWKPEDLRTEDNKRVAKYTDETILIEDAIALVDGDIRNLVNGLDLGIDKHEIRTCDCTVVPKTHTGKGTDLSKMGMVDGKYEKSGNWAWADIEVSVVLTKNGQEVYYLTNVELVSGQLKKPHLTKTAFAEDVKKSLEEAGLLAEDTKTEDAPKEEETKKSGKGRSKGKKEDK